MFEFENNNNGSTLIKKDDCEIVQIGEFDQEESAETICNMLNHKDLEIWKMKKLIKEMSNYLDFSITTSICSSSGFHNAMKEIIE